MSELEIDNGQAGGTKTFTERVDVQYSHVAQYVRAVDGVLGEQVGRGVLVRVFQARA